METQLLHGAVSNTVWALALALFAMVAGMCVRRPAVTHALWVLVLLKLFTPPLVAVPIGSAPRQLPMHHVPAVQSSAHTSLPPQHTNHPIPSLAAGTATDGSQEQFAGDEPAPAPAHWRWLNVAALSIWLLGSMACAVVASWRIARFVRLLRSASPAPAALQNEANSLAARLGLRRAPAILLLPGKFCPMLWAPPFSPRIVLPAELWDRLSQGERDGLLLHEMAHLRRRDHWVRLLELAATIAFWWNPLVWWARSRLRQAEEQCCDAWVTWASPRGAEDYAAALVEAVDFASRTYRAVVFQPALPILASGMGQFQQLKRRLIMIHSGKNARKRGVLGTVCVCMAAAVLPLAMAGRAADPVAPPAKANADAERRHKAATAGLDWLAAHVPVKAAADAKNSPGHQTAIISLYGLAFLGSGSDLKDGPYRAQLASCIDRVLADCKDDGLIAAPGNIGPMYDHGYGTLFLAEAFARTHDERIKPKLERAVALLEKSQSPGGGWRYTPTPMDGDTSVTACELNALAAAKAAGIAVPPKVMDDAAAYLLSCQNADGGLTYIHAPNTASGPARTSAAAAALQHAGGKQKEVDATIKYLEHFLDGKPGAEAGHPGYTHFYASQLLASTGNAAARPLLEKMTAAIIAAQQPDGSWVYPGIGREYDTACSVIALESPDGRLWIFGAGGK